MWGWIVNNAIRKACPFIKIKSASDKIYNGPMSTKSLANQKETNKENIPIANNTQPSALVQLTTEEILSIHEAMHDITEPDSVKLPNGKEYAVNSYDGLRRCVVNGILFCEHNKNLKKDPYTPKVRYHTFSTHVVKGNCWT